MKDGVDKGFGGSPAPRADRGEVAVEPRRVGGQVTFSRSHLVDPSCQELGEAHERVGG